MDSPQEMFGNVKEEVERRMRSPFVGAYVIAWCVLNYEFLIVVFSSGEYAYKIGYIAQHLFYGVSPWHTFGWPAAIAAASTIVIPLLNLLTDLWGKGVDILGSHLSLWMETGRRLSDRGLRDLIRQRASERDSIRRYAHETLKQSAVTAYRLFAVGHQRLSDVRQLTGAIRVRDGLPDDVKRMLENVGLPAQAYRMLKLLHEEGVLDETRLLRDSRSGTQEDESRKVLGVLLGAQLLDLIWESGVEPNYEISVSGKVVLTFIFDNRPELFTPRPLVSPV